jgi:hypothetical protein
MPQICSNVKLKFEHYITIVFHNIDAMLVLVSL